MGKILPVIMAIKNEEGLSELVTELITSCAKYQQAVLEHQMALLDYDLPGSRARIEQADHDRRIVHDGLLSVYSLLGRNYQNIKKENCPLYRLADPDKRKEVGRLALDLALELALDGY